MFPTQTVSVSIGNTSTLTSPHACVLYVECVLMECMDTCPCLCHVWSCSGWLRVCTHVYVRTLIWLLSQWQVENGSTACHWSSVIHSQQWSMEAEKPAPIVMLSYMDSWSHYLALDPTDSFSLQYSLFTANLFPLARPADNLLYAVLILFMDLS